MQFVEEASLLPTGAPTLHPKSFPPAGVLTSVPQALPACRCTSLCTPSPSCPQVWSLLYPKNFPPAGMPAFAPQVLPTCRYAHLHTLLSDHNRLHPSAHRQAS